MESIQSFRYFVDNISDILNAEIEYEVNYINGN
jgi:hypothetical protein